LTPGKGEICRIFRVQTGYDAHCVSWALSPGDEAAEIWTRLRTPSSTEFPNERCCISTWEKCLQIVVIWLRKLFRLGIRKYVRF